MTSNHKVEGSSPSVEANSNLSYHPTLDARQRERLKMLFIERAKDKCDGRMCHNPQSTYPLICSCYQWAWERKDA